MGIINEQGKGGASFRIVFFVHLIIGLSDILDIFFRSRRIVGPSLYLTKVIGISDISDIFSGLVRLTGFHCIEQN